MRERKVDQVRLSASPSETLCGARKKAGAFAVLSKDDRYPP